MKNKSRYAVLHFATKLPLVILYFSFLTVQIFSFNFDICDNSNINTQVLSFNHPATAHQPAAAYSTKANTGKNTKKNIRLNKRFQPEKAVYCTIIPFKKPGYILLDAAKPACIKLIATSAYPATCLLRGPPVVA